jgi:hypothetical protein
MLPFHLHLRLLIVIFISGVRTKAFLFPSMRATFHAHLILLV